MSSYLSRTFSGANTSRTTFTLSFWVKRTSLGSVKSPISAETNNNDYDQVIFTSSDQLDVNNVAGGSDVISFKTTAVFRDPSAWYHIVIAIDTTQASSSNGVKIYINGVLQTSFASSTYAQNATFEIGRDGATTSIGRRERDGDAYGVGYLSQFYYIDGQQKAATDFGQTDSTTGIWKPKGYAGTYGNNGFFLKFENSAALGTDSSGNSETFTVNNAGTNAQVVDTPDNNFCIMNCASNYYAQGIFTEGGCKLVTGGAAYTYNTSTIGVGKGKWYMEVKIGAGVNTWWGVGIAEGESSNGSGVLGRDTYYPSGNEYGQIGWFGYGTDFVYQNDGYYSGSTNDYATDGFTTNDILSIALDADNNKVYFYKNGTVQNGGTGFNIGASSTGFWHYAFGDYDGANAGSHTFQLNFGNPSFTISSNSGNGYTDANNFGKFQYTVPSGYYSLCTQNLKTYG